MNRIMIVVMLVAATLGLGGCFSAADVAKMDTVEVAEHYGQFNGVPMSLIDPKLFEGELKKRQTFTDEEWQRINSREIKVGDSCEFVAAAWGKRNRAGSITLADGVRSWWEFDVDSTKPGVYGTVYFHGRVVAIER